MNLKVSDVDHVSAFREIFLSCVEGIFVFQDGKVIMVNPQCELLFGYNAGEMIGLFVESFIPTEIKAHHEKLRHGYEAHPEKRSMGVGRDLLAKRKDGSVFPVEVSLSPAVVNDKRSVIAHIIEISQRKKIEDDLKKSEEQLIQYAAELEKRVEERTQELANAVKNLESANQSLHNENNERIKAENEAKVALAREKELSELKSRFVSMASHEFRTPLTTILSSVSLIAKYGDTSMEEKRNKHVSRIKSNVGELTAILNDFLSMDKLDAGKMTANLVTFELCSFVEEVISEMNSQTKKDQLIVFTSQIKNYLIESDPQILKQSMLNLISNAIKYSPEGSKIELAAVKDKQKIALSVSDHGMGIPDGDQKHLFEKFFRAHNSAHIQGTGLGLNIVKKYLELIDGEITFESIEGKGSTFTISLNEKSSTKNSVD